MAIEANLGTHEGQQQRVEALHPEDVHGQQQNNTEHEQRVNDEEPRERTQRTSVE